jgi:uncharacterized short protein YbdD (DUF466 family)
MSGVGQAMRRFWAGLRAVTGDDAYERYLAHCRERHPGAIPLARKEFQSAELERRWKGIIRCC